MQEAVSYVVGLFEDPSNFAAGPYDDVSTALGDENYGEIDPYEVLEQAMDELGYDPDTQAAVMEAAHSSAAAEATATATATAEGGYSLEQLAGIFAEGIKVNIDNSEVINQIDNSMYVEGDVKGGIHQSNYTEVTNADDGAIVTDGDNYGDQQTGDGVQVGEAYGDVVQGDGNATGGGIIGDGNTQVGQAIDSNFAQGDVTEDNSWNDASQNTWTDESDHSFTDNTADSFNDQSDNSFTDNTSDSFNDESDNSFTDNTADSFNSEQSQEWTDNTSDSYNEEWNDNTSDSYNTEQSQEWSDDDQVDIDVNTGHGEPHFEEHGYEPLVEEYDHGYDHDHVDIDVHDNEILD
jgi:hypothetical protein